MSIDHIGIQTLDYQKAILFYDAILSTLGYMKLITIDDNKAIGFGYRFPSFWLNGARTSNESTSQNGTHIAFVASSRSQVDDFYRTALKNGAKSNGLPGLRPQYHRFYYAAFVIDADGNNIEAVNHFDWRSFIGWKIMVSTILIVPIGIVIARLF